MSVTSDIPYNQCTIPYNQRTRVLTVFGTRPEAIKMIPVIKALQDSGKFRPVVVSTGQHTDMVERLIDDFGLRLDVNLHVAKRIGGVPPTLNHMVARTIRGIDAVWQSEELPEEYRGNGRRSVHGAQACLVHGDTSSALAVAIAAFNLQIPVFHVEAGLRTSNVLEPFPEEGNRQIISRIAALHFAPTTANKANLIREGVDYDRIVVTGNTSIDMLQWVALHPGGFGPGLEELAAQEQANSGLRIVLITAHRRENWGKGLQRIADAVDILSTRYPTTQFVIPMHPNPIAQAPMRATLAGKANVHLVQARDYDDFARLMRAATLVITDSGGVQEEAPAFGKPVIVTRNETERREGVDAGTLILTGTDTARIAETAEHLLDDPAAYADCANRTNPYGDGHASERIVQTLDHIFLGGPPPQQLGQDAIRAAVLRRLGISSFAAGRAGHDGGTE